MFRIPVLSRLYLTDYLNIVFVFLALALENILRACINILPDKLVDSFQGINFTQYRRDIDYFCEVDYHYTTTKDNYVLCMHRLPNEGKPVVLLWHGCMMSSEVWVCSRKELSIAKYIHSLGYDVWMGNNRGNKYSKKHLYLSNATEEYWNFSLDHFILLDIPAVVDFMLKFTKQSTFSYVGFSQGTAQFFGALSAIPELEEKLNVMIALSAVIKPNSLRKSIPAALIQSSPALLFLLFGHRSILSVTNFWSKTLNAKYFAKIIDFSVNILFNWKSDKIDANDKLTLYRHLYSTSSVKTIVHWFQIIANKELQYYSDNKDSFAKQPKYPVERIKSKIYIALGTKDTLGDKDYLKSKLKNCEILDLEDYEHLDVLWGATIDKDLFPFIKKGLLSVND